MNASIVQTVEEVLAPLDRWAKQCHEASVELVRSGVLGEARVARGGCRGVGSQHSWVVLGMDCYDDSAEIIDPTLWSYDQNVNGIWYGSYRNGLHTPHGKGSIWRWGRPDEATDEVLTLTPRTPFSDEAQRFLDLLGPLDMKGWSVLAHAPVENWPAGEILTAMCETNVRFEAIIPIDTLGMATLMNPSGLYLNPEQHPPKA